MSNDKQQARQPEAAATIDPMVLRAALADAQSRVEKPAIIADPQKGLVYRDPGPPAGAGYRVQNMTDHLIGDFVPGEVKDVSGWDARRLARLEKSAAFRAEHLKVLKPGDKDPLPAKAPFERLSRHKEADALALVAKERNGDKLRFWLADDERPEVAKALEAQLRAVK